MRARPSGSIPEVISRAYAVPEHGPWDVATPKHSIKPLTFPWKATPEPGALE